MFKPKPGNVCTRLNVGLASRADAEALVAILERNGVNILTLPGSEQKIFPIYGMDGKPTSDQVWVGILGEMSRDEFERDFGVKFVTEA